MSLKFNPDKITSIIFFNPNMLKESSYKRSKYNILHQSQAQINATIYPNEDDSEKKQISSFKKFREENYREIRRSGKFCEGLTALYIKESLKDCDAIVRIESSMTRSKKLIGFATLKFMKSSKSLYIDTICTNTDVKGTGSFMIKFLSDVTKELSLDGIKLNSVTEAVPFYLKMQFECDPTCKMIKTIEGGSKTPKNKTNKTNKTNKNKSRKNMTRRMH